MPSLRFTLVTAQHPGAVAVFHLTGADVPAALTQLTGRATFAPARVYLCDLAGIDAGLVTIGTSAAGAVFGLVMPHGGPRVIARITAHLHAQGGEYVAELPVRELYPEARSELEADMLAALARAASPAAIDLLLAQPKLWRDLLTRWERAGVKGPGDIPGAVAPGPDSFDHLLVPPAVVVVGRPNVGKSTLANALRRQTASIVADLPGTTRDWVAGLADLDGLCVRWFDTPGLRRTTDPIEARAIELASHLSASADVLIALRDPATPWPDLSDSTRAPDLWVVNKCDTAGQVEHAPEPDGSLQHPLHLSARTGAKLDRLAGLIRARLGLADLSPRGWAFTSRLKSLVREGDIAALRRYLGQDV